MAKNKLTITWSDAPTIDVATVHILAGGGVDSTNTYAPTSTSTQAMLEPGEVRIGLTYAKETSYINVTLPKTAQERATGILYNTPCFRLKEIDSSNGVVSLDVLPNSPCSYIQLVSVGGGRSTRQYSSQSLQQLDINIFEEVEGYDVNGVLLEVYKIAPLNDTKTQTSTIIELVRVETITATNPDDAADMLLSFQPIRLTHYELDVEVHGTDGTVIHRCKAKDLREFKMNPLTTDFIRIKSGEVLIEEKSIHTISCGVSFYRTYDDSVSEDDASKLGISKILFKGDPTTPGVVDITAWGLKPGERYYVRESSKRELRVSGVADKYGILTLEGVSTHATPSGGELNIISKHWGWYKTLFSQHIISKPDSVYNDGVAPSFNNF